MKRRTNKYRIIMWLAIVAMFAVIHTPKDKVVVLCNILLENAAFIKGLFSGENGAMYALMSLAARLKYIVFLLSLIILYYHLIQSFKRAELLWNSQALKKRLLISGITYVFLSLFVFPVNIDGYGLHYARISISPFEVMTSWYHRRLLMPAIAHFLGFQGNCFTIYFP